MQRDRRGQILWKQILWLWKKTRTVLVFIAGMVVLVIGVGMIVLPGPAIVFIPLGLAILATEFVWARKWLEHINQRLKELKQVKITPRNEKPVDES